MVAETPDHPPQVPGLSRRKVMAHIAWATPAILVASAAPAVAASGTSVLQLSNVGARAQHSGGPDRYVFAHATVTCGPSDPATTPLSLRFGFASGLVADQTPLFLGGAGWSYQGNTLAGGMRYFVYRWDGTALSGSNTSTTECSIRVHATGHGSFSTTVHIEASGQSLGIPVSAAQSLTVSST